MIIVLIVVSRVFSVTKLVQLLWVFSLSVDKMGLVFSWHFELTVMRLMPPFLNREAICKLSLFGVSLIKLHFQVLITFELTFCAFWASSGRRKKKFPRQFIYLLGYPTVNLMNEFWPKKLTCPDFENASLWFCCQVKNSLRLLVQLLFILVHFIAFWSTLSLFSIYFDPF